MAGLVKLSCFVCDDLGVLCSSRASQFFFLLGVSLAV